MNEIFENLYEMTAFSNIIAEPQFLIMYAIAFVLLYLGIKKQYEPLLLVPIAFGVLLANFPGGDMGVIQADENGMVMINGVMKNIWEMPLHDIAHELGLMNFIYYMLIKTGFLPPIIFMGVGALTDFGPMLRNLRLSIFGAAAQLGMCGEYLLISSCGPVKIRIHHAPFLGCHGTDHNGIVRLKTTVPQCLCNTKHQGDRCIVILESVKIGIIVCRQKDHAVRMFPGNLTHNIISRAVPGHPGFRIKGDRYFLLITQQLQQACRIFSGNGKSGSILRSGDILCIQSFIVDFAVAAALHCDQGCGSFQMCLVYRIIDPPLISLVNLKQ